MRSIEGDPMVWPHPRDVILYARSSYYYCNMFIICLFLTFFLILTPVFLSLIPKNCGNVCHNIAFLDVTSTCFPSLVPCLLFPLRNVPAKAGNRISPVLKDSDLDSENLSLLIRLSVSDGQKTDSFKVGSVIGI